MPVEITVKLLLAAMQKSETEKFLIDGFPRSLNNYEVYISFVGGGAAHSWAYPDIVRPRRRVCSSLPCAHMFVQRTPCSHTN